MKKFGLLAGALVLSALAGGCFGENVPDDIAEAAIEEAKGKNIVTVTRKNPVISGETKGIGAEAPKTEGGPAIWNNDYLYLTTDQQYTDLDTGKEYVVKIDWTYENKDMIFKSEKVDDNHKVLYFNYSESESQTFKFSATLKIGKKSEKIDYEVELAVKNVKFDEYSIEEIYELNDEGSDFKLVDSTKGWYKGNAENIEKGITYCYIQTYGEVLYTAPDGNWALVGAGDRVLELYSGSALNLKPSYYPALQVGKSVRIEGEMSVYGGNGQMSFIFDINECEKSKFTPFSGNYSTLSGEAFEGKKYFESELMNGLFTATAVYKGNLSTGTVEKMKPGNRATFDAEIDGKKITVAYDYHSDDKTAEEWPVLEALKAKLSTLNVGDTFTIKGTVRFAGDTNTYKNTYKNQPVGKWSIVPFAADHIA